MIKKKHTALNILGSGCWIQWARASLIDTTLLLSGLKFRQSRLGKQWSAVAKSDSLHDRHKSCPSLSLRSLSSRRHKGKAVARLIEERVVVPICAKRRRFCTLDAFYARHYKMHAGVSPSSSSRAKRSRAGNCIENWNSRRYLRPVFIRLISRSRSPHLCRAQYFCWQLPNNYQLNGGSGERKWIIGLAVGNWKQIGYSARRVRSWGKWENWIVCERE